MEGHPPGPISLLAFPSFSQFPLELQIKIYKLIASEPRTVKIQRKNRLVQPTILNPNPPPHMIVYLACHDPVPVALQICRASRTEAMKLYSPAFHAESLSRFVWVNFDTDTIKIDDGALLFRTNQQDRARMRNIILEVSESFEDQSYYMKAFSPMKNLEKLDIISGEKLSSWTEFLPDLRGWFEDWFGSLEGWMHPEVRIIEQTTGTVMDYMNYEAMQDIFDRQNWEEVEARMRIARANGQWTGGRGTGRPYPGRIRRGG